MKNNEAERKGLLYPVFTARGHDAGILLLRLFAGGLLIRHGIQKVENFDALSTTFADPVGMGSKLSLILIILAEIGGSALVVLGLLTRPAALAVVFGMFVAAFFSYPGPFSMKSSEMPILYLAMFTVLAVTGGGRYSADEAVRRRLIG
ncbi:MAG: DoxX family protein [Alistipes sp.]|nr:DoxX family protein [Alistipes sp.]